PPEPPPPPPAIPQPEIALEHHDLTRPIGRPRSVPQRDRIYGGPRQAHLGATRHRRPIVLIQRVRTGIAPPEVHRPAVGREPHGGRRRADQVGAPHDALDGEGRRGPRTL